MMDEVRGEIKRRTVLGVIGALLAGYPVQALAQEQRTRKVGILVLRDLDGEALSRELRKDLTGLGYHEGQNIEFELRSAAGQSDRLAGLAGELVRLKVNVI